MVRKDLRDRAVNFGTSDGDEVDVGADRDHL